MAQPTSFRDPVLQGLRAGAPVAGPLEVHLDLTNGCNARCITCWDHSPLLTTPRPAAWKRQRLGWDAFQALVDELAAFGTVRHVVLSGMGDPLTHPDVYRMLARVRREGWRVTLLSNLLAADVDALLADPPHTLLVGVHGATPAAWTAFHPGWTEEQFFQLCASLRRLVRAGVVTRHVQVIDRTTAREVPEMADFGADLGADRVNYKLASLAGGTEATAVTPSQVAWLMEEGIPRAAERAERRGVRTNLDLFRLQVAAAAGAPLHTTPMEQVGCAMGYVYTRVAVDGTLLFCCNTEAVVGHLDHAPLRDQWFGARWQELRERLAAGRFLPGCERCGKFEQNVKWARRLAGGT